MISRIVEISNPAYLSTRNEQLVITQENVEVATVPLEDLGVLILDHHTIAHTQGLLAKCAECNVAVIICDEKHLPCCMLLPFASHSLHTKTLAKQIVTTEPTKKRLWQTIVQAKVKAQAKLLTEQQGRDSGVGGLAAFVRSGDPDNVEAQAARIYFQKLFGDEFYRERGGGGANALLNYGYAVLRAAMARSIVATGLHPAIGVYHHNQYNPFCLADDLMEPLRPIVDAHVIELIPDPFDPDSAPELIPQTKRDLLRFTQSYVMMKSKRTPLMTALQMYAAGARKALCGEARKLDIPLR